MKLKKRDERQGMNGIIEGRSRIFRRERKGESIGYTTEKTEWDVRKGRTKKSESS